jgi:hypothetical protein
MRDGQDADRAVGGRAAKSKDSAGISPITRVVTADPARMERTNEVGEIISVPLCLLRPTVGLKDDAINIDQSEVEFRIDTDPAIVRRFLERQTEDIKVIFSTYHSSSVVGKGAEGLPPIDLAIFDEAHKTTGLAGGAFGYALLDRNICVRKRLFLTATPRHIHIRHRDREGDFRISSMDDETVYGPRALQKLLKKELFAHTK